VVAVDGKECWLAVQQTAPWQIVELASIAVILFRQRHRRLIIEHLLVLAPDSHLTRRPLGSFYMKWGFRGSMLQDAPTIGGRKVMSIVGKLFLPDVRLLVMVLK
jgi:hypothetical protein